jgi:hypothetical protein
MYAYVKFRAELAGLDYGAGVAWGAGLDEG